MSHRLFSYKITRLRNGQKIELVITFVCLFCIYDNHGKSSWFEIQELRKHISKCHRHRPSTKYYQKYKLANMHLEYVVNSLWGKSK